MIQVVRISKVLKTRETRCILSVRVKVTTQNYRSYRSANYSAYLLLNVLIWVEGEHWIDLSFAATF